MKKPNKKATSKHGSKQKAKTSRKTTAKAGRVNTSKGVEKRTEKDTKKSVVSKSDTVKVSTKPVRKRNKKTKRRTKKGWSIAEIETLELLEKESGLKLDYAKEERARISEKSSTKSHERKDEKPRQHKTNVRPLQFTERKKRGEPLYTVEIGNAKRQSVERLIRSVNITDFKFAKRIEQGEIPNYAVLIIKTYNKADGQEYFYAIPSGFTRSVSNRKAIQKFIAEALADFNNDTLPEIMNNYDVNYNDIKILSFSVRFIYPL